MVLPGGTEEFTKTVYDGLGDAIDVYTGYDPTMPTLGTSDAYAEAQGPSASDIILEETDTQYDAAGDTTFVTTLDRYDDTSTSATGALSALAATDSRASYVGYWFDGIGRETASQNFGAAATAPTIVAADGQPGTDYSGATQVSLTDFNARGEAYETVDPAGNVTVTTDDDEGRTTETIQNLSSTISAATNITTDYAFNGGTALFERHERDHRKRRWHGHAEPNHGLRLRYGHALRRDARDLPQRSGLRRDFRAYLHFRVDGASWRCRRW